MSHLDPRPYPRLTAEQKDRMLADLAQEYALNNLRFVPPATAAMKPKQLELFSAGQESPGDPPVTSHRS
jgi:hypothetical protein